MLSGRAMYVWNVQASLNQGPVAAMVAKAVRAKLSSLWVKIGDGAVAIAQSGIPHDVPAGAMVSGAPALDHRLWLKCCAAYAKLPEIAKAVRKLSERE